MKMKPPGRPPAAAGPAGESDFTIISRRHLRLGWWSLLVFLTLGIALETLHGFKVSWYLNVSNETRRLMWTLAHAHGTLLGVINVLFALSLVAFPSWHSRKRRFASASLIAATILIPGGFFLGGAVIHSGDPGIGIFLLPLGALLLLLAVFLTARAAEARDAGPGGPGSGIKR